MPETPEQLTHDQDAAEEVDALPVLAPAAPAAAAPQSAALVRTGVARPAVQAAAVAAGSFVAGAAVAGIVHRHRRRVARPARRRHRSARKGARASELVQVVASRTLLVDVHLLGTPSTER